MFSSKVVVRAGWGMYYDRGELFTYLSPGFASGVIAGGPFGVNQTPPWVNSDLQCSIFRIHTTARSGFRSSARGNTLGAVHARGNPANLQSAQCRRDRERHPALLVCRLQPQQQAALHMNQTLDIQWQPRNDLAIEIGYVGNLGRHDVFPCPSTRRGSPRRPTRFAVPLPSAQSRDGILRRPTPTAIRSSDSPGSFSTDQPAQRYSRIRQTSKAATSTARSLIGYSSESESYTAAGFRLPRAAGAPGKAPEPRLQLASPTPILARHRRTKRHGTLLQRQQPARFALRLRSLRFRPHARHQLHLHYELPKFFSVHFQERQIADGWAISGLTVIQSGQPYSIVDYSGAVGSIFYGVNDGITNPIVPLSGCTPKSALTGASAPLLAFPRSRLPALRSPPANPGDLNGAIPQQRSLRNQFHRQRPAQYLPAGLAEARRHLDRQRPPKSRSASAEVHFRCLQPDQHAQLRHPIDNVDQNINFNGFPVPGAGGFHHNALQHRPSLPCTSVRVTQRLGHHEQDDWKFAADSDVAELYFLVCNFDSQREGTADCSPPLLFFGAKFISILKDLDLRTASDWWHFWSLNGP